MVAAHQPQCGCRNGVRHRTAYQDYLNGQLDGQDHWDQAQKEADGKLILHGGNRNVPYISPGENYGRYLTLGVKRALDAGAAAIHLEEPEFWARGGWEENFKREWKAYYHEDWQPPDSSPDAQYRASKLKYYLFRRALSQIFDFAREYGREHHREIRCYVPTHSLINYLHWKIVSPESSLIDVGATDTSRRFGPGPREPRMFTRGGAKSEPSRLRSWNTVPCRTWCRPRGGVSGI